jgi:hypothetical protein
MKETSFAIIALALACAGAHTVCAQSTVFTYQGRLMQSGLPANGLYEMQFTLFDAATNGNSVGTPVAVAPVAVSNGVFTASLDFGAAAFTGADRWLEISVTVFGSDQPMTTLVPRQPITPVPYALHAHNAAGLMSFNNAPLEIKVNGERVLRLEVTGSGPNIIGGASVNDVAPGVVGATISGGGTSSPGFEATNRVEANYGTISGGAAHTIQTGSRNSTIGGGWQNTIHADSGWSTIGGGESNTIEPNARYSTISGGGLNKAGGFASVIVGGSLNTVQTNAEHSSIGGGLRNWIAANAMFSTIAGGNANTNRREYGTIGGGDLNVTAGFYATVGGGRRNTSSGGFATVAGGYENTASEETATVGGGFANSAGHEASTVAGGAGNTADADYATIGGGSGNSSSGDVATVSGGLANIASGQIATISGGQQNTASGENATIGGGHDNTNVAASAVIAGGARNTAQGLGSAIGGGLANRTEGDAATVGGGSLNRAGGYVSTIAGGSANASDGFYGAVGGGQGNTTDNIAASVLGGEDNRATASYAAIGGGRANLASGYASVIAGGGGLGPASDDPVGNTAAGDWAAVAGGFANRVEGQRGIIGGGNDNTIPIGSVSATISGGYFNTAGGLGSMVPGGGYNEASGNLSFAAGFGAKALHSGSFVWADGVEADFLSMADNQFSVRASGGVRFVSAVDTNGSNIAGVTLPPGSGAWSSLSDRNAKENFTTTNPREILGKVAALPMASWNYKAQGAAVRHLGPMAQDFHAAFGLGESDRTITSVDADGVALAAIQGLNAKLEEELKVKDARIAELERRLAGIEKLLGRTAAK